VTLCDAPAIEGADVVELRQQHRSPVAIELACRKLVAAESVSAANVEPRLFLFRAGNPRAEAAFIAQRVREWLDAGAAADRIAVLFRSVRNVATYEAALLDRDVPIVTGGDANVFADRRALDALALLWNVFDPFRHDWMLRTLGNPGLCLSDASLATLCSEPPNPQTPLFVLDDELAPTARASRWDPKRDLRLGWNVVRGEQDGALSPEARSRIERFRALRVQWLDAMQALPFDAFARLVWRDGLAREGEPGSARARAQQLVLRRLLARLTAFARERPGTSIAEILEFAERRRASDLEACEDVDGTEGVRLLSIDAARGREFDRVVVADVRAGAFPRWYSPDAFLFSPRLGMIPKENAGDARASRTAKFTYYTHRNKTRERYNERERRALAYALRRARVCALVTASHPPTRGVAAPELLEELKNARLPGTQCLE
jgi:superfamily I DNA/RNA helicase